MEPHGYDRILFELRDHGRGYCGRDLRADHRFAGELSEILHRICGIPGTEKGLGGRKGGGVLPERIPRSSAGSRACAVWDRGRLYVGDGRRLLDAELSVGRDDPCGDRVRGV